MKLADIYLLLIFFIWFPAMLFFVAYAKRKRDGFFNRFSMLQQKDIINYSDRTVWTKRIFIFSALALLTFAAARPQMGSSEINMKSEGIDIAIVLDVSLSMLAEDEDGARFEKGRQLLIDAISELQGDRVSLIPFSGAAFLQLPLTSDYNTALSVLSEMRPGIITKPGTALNTAVELGIESLKTGNEGTDKLMVIVSDGEDPDLDFDGVKDLLEKNSIKLAVLPLGTPEGAPIKVGDSYLNDEGGKMVVSKLNKSFFDKSKDSLGAMEIKHSETVSAFIKTFKNRSKMEEKRIQLYKEQFQIPLFLGILLYFLFLSLPAGRKK